MCNPAKTDDREGNRTLQQLRELLTLDGYGGFVACNAFAFRGSHRELTRVAAKDFAEAVGPRNDEHLRFLADSGFDVVVAFGALLRGSELARRKPALRELFPAVYSYGLTNDGEPPHPLRPRGLLNRYQWPS
jgi:hypothetical protein